MHILIDRPKGSKPDFICGQCGVEYPGGMLYFSEEEKRTRKYSCPSCGAYDTAHWIKSNYNNALEYDLAGKSRLVDELRKLTKEYLQCNHDLTAECASSKKEVAEYIQYNHDLAVKCDELNKLVGELRHSVKIQADLLVQQADMSREQPVNTLKHDLNHILNIPMGGDILGAVRALQEDRKRATREVHELRKALRCDDESYTNKLQRRIDRRDEDIARLEKACAGKVEQHIANYQAGIKKDRAERANLQRQVVYKEAVLVALQDRMDDVTDQRDALQERNDRQTKRLNKLQRRKKLSENYEYVKKQLRYSQQKRGELKADLAEAKDLNENLRFHLAKKAANSVNRPTLF